MFRNFNVLGVIFVIILALAGWYFFGLSRPAPAAREAVIREQVFKIEIADTAVSRMQGLSGRKDLDEQNGMLFVFKKPDKYGFWMKDMLFPIDIVWISGDRVAGFAESVLPESSRAPSDLEIYYPPEPVDKVLEISAGLVKKYGFKAGNIIEIR